MIKVHFPILNGARNFLVAVCVLIGMTAQSQEGSPVTDAPKLKMAIDELKARPDATKAQKVVELVNANSSTQYVSYQHLIDSIPRENYIYEELKSIPVNAADKNLAVMPSDIFNNNAEAQAGAGFGSILIDAAGTFIAERFKQEMEIAFLNKFKEWLEGSGTPNVVLQSLFPITRRVLYQHDPYQYTVFLETLKESLRKDVNNLPSTMGVYLATDPFQIAARNPYYFTALLLYNNIVLVSNGQSVVVSLQNLGSDSLILKGPSSIRSLLSLTSLVANLLANPARTGEWLDAGKIRTNLNNPAAVKMFFGLTMMKYRVTLEQIRFGSTSLYTIIASRQDKLNAILDWIKSVAENLRVVYDNYVLIRDIIDNGRDIVGQKILDLQNSFIVSFESFFRIPFADLGITLDAGARSNFENAVAAVRLFTELVINIKEKNYGLAVTNVITMLTAMVGDPSAINLVKKYGNFAASVAKATNKNEMLDALNTAALPVGSYRIKRNSFRNISLNAFAGLAGGAQVFSSEVPASVKKTNAILGFTAPIGLAWSFGHVNKKDSLNESSSTIFISVLDIGAVTAFRLTRDSSASLPELKFKNLLAPGLFYVYGFRRLPVSLGGGVQYGPQLRNIKDNSALLLPPAWTIRLFVTVDIPFINFYTRTEPRKK